MTYVPCLSCGEQMQGMITYNIFSSYGKSRYICHECKTDLNELTQRVPESLTEDERTEFKRLCECREGIKN